MQRTVKCVPILLVCCWSLGTAARAQTTPDTPPEAVVVAARAFAQAVSGRQLGAAPVARYGVGQKSLRPYWQLDWLVVPVEKQYIRVTVDEVSLHSSTFSDDTVDQADRAAHPAGQALTVTQAQAVAEADRVFGLAPKLSGDWGAWFIRQPEGPGATSAPVWQLVRRLRHDGKRLTVLDGLNSVIISPYTGKVKRWELNDSVRFSPPTGPLITPAQALQIARQEYTRATGFDEPPTKSGTLVWGRSPFPGDLFRLAYQTWWYWKTKEGQTITPEELFGPTPPHFAQQYWITVDAETGEVTGSETTMGGAGGVKIRPFKPGPRQETARRLLHGTAPLAVVNAVLSGKSLHETAAMPKGRAFACKAGTGVVSFVWNEAAQTLFWQSDSRAWMCVTLSKKCARDLLTWLGEGSISP